MYGQTFMMATTFQSNRIKCDHNEFAKEVFISRQMLCVQPTPDLSFNAAEYDSLPKELRVTLWFPSRSDQVVVHVKCLLLKRS